MKELFLSIIQAELKWLARFVCQRFRPYVIGITGSSGKTTTKYMIGELLKSKTLEVYVASGNLNTETGLPLATIGFDKSPETAFDWISVFFTAPFRALFRFSYPEYLVLEYAADKPGDIGYLLSIVKPDIAVITNFGVAHIEAFKKMENIVREKWQLAIVAKKIICTEEVARKGRAVEYPLAEIITPGRDTIFTTNVKALTNKTEFDLSIYGKKVHASFEYLGEHNVANFELAALTAIASGVSASKITELVPNLQPQEGRGRRIFAARDIVILDESYNANPLSMLAALKVFAEMKFGRKVAILGEMKEIGPITQRSHQEVAKFAKRVSDFTIGVGGGFRDLELDKWYPNVEKLKEEAKDLLKRGDIVLIKGSHSNRLDKLVNELL